MRGKSPSIPLKNKGEKTRLPRVSIPRRRTRNDRVKLTAEEEAIQETIIAARKIQNFLWAGINTGAGFEEFRRMLRKRLAKMDAIQFSNPYWKIEARKRLLQVAAIAVQCIGRLDDPGFQGSNLGEYSEPVKGTIPASAAEPCRSPLSTGGAQVQDDEGKSPSIPLKNKGEKTRLPRVSIPRRRTRNDNQG